MATLVLTAVGTALGGPIGGALGALAGQAVDAHIFKPRERAGPRLSDLRVQTSRYGDRVPRLFGRMRVAGTVIWSTDLREAAVQSGGGKGQPSMTSYNYSASFAVALSARPIIGVGRIWADGNLLRGEAGDFKSPLGALRIHQGGAGQAVDPLIASAVGIDQAPAFRGIAYAVMEDLQLADFGNRIPSLTFEVVADAAPVAISALATDLLGRPVTYLGTHEPLVAGYAGDGTDASAALAPLVEAHGLLWRFNGETVALVDAVATGRSLMPEAGLRTVDGRTEPAVVKRCIAIDQLPKRFSVRHFDPDRDYQAGIQSVERAGPGLRDEELGLPALLSADAARDLADRRLRSRMGGRRSMMRALGWAELDFQVGDLLGMVGERHDWRVEAIEWEGMAARLTLRSHAVGSALPASGDAGFAVRQGDLAHGATQLAAIELPLLDGTLAAAPHILVGATGDDAGWRRAALFRFRPEFEHAEPIGATAPRAVLGVALTVLAPAAAWTIDALGFVDIELRNSADSLVGIDEEALLRGENLCVLGPELLQFGNVEAIGAKRYRLSRLIRGCRGTEWAISLHEAGEPFLLVDPSCLAPVPSAMADLGTMLTVRAVGIGDALPAQATLLVDGRSILPPAPVHGVMVEAAGGDLELRWTRRSRLGWHWPDGTDVPLGEEREAYHIRVFAADETLREIESLTAGWTYSAADRAIDLALASGASLRIDVRQIGMHGFGPPLAFSLS